MGRAREFARKHRQVILYLSFGTVTTACSLLACFLTLRLGVRIWHNEKGEPTALLDVVASTVQWTVGVIVAFLTSKKFVFVDADHGARVTLRQMGTFACSRLLLYFLEVGVNLGVIALLGRLSYRTVELWRIPLSARFWAKASSSLVMMFANYYVSKLVVFRKRGKRKEKRGACGETEKKKSEKDSKRY